jgi:hypothetical protein
MTHLVIHLVDEFHICGPIHARWMYPIESAMKDLKDYVQARGGYGRRVHFL